MKNRLEACVVLGCSGSILEHKFCLCQGTSNKIIDLTLLDEDVYKDVLTFLEQACDLFNSVMCDYNKCVNCLSLLYQNYNAFDQKMLFNIQSFLKLHRNCGVWIMLIMKEDIMEKE